MKHLVIPDPHASPDTPLDRFEWLGKFIMDKRPDKIICMGDFADMPSLCTYDKGTKGYEGRRYRKDILAVRDAMSKILAPLHHHNFKQAQYKKAQYKPELHMCMGNHEHRISRAVECDAILEGTIGLDDLGYEECGWKVHPFKEVVGIDGVAYSHYHISGVMGKPISGIHPAANLISKHFVSCVAGHAHILDYSVRTDALGKKLHGLVCGVFDDSYHQYAGKANDLWWRGLVMLHNVKDGDFQPEFISMDTLKKEYS